VGLVEAGTLGWSSPRVLLALAAGGLALSGFLAWERRAPAPMVPLGFFRARAFAAASATSLLAYFGLFGALFLLGQLLQTGLGATRLHAGLRLLAMTGAMVATAPTASALCDRIGPRPLMSRALALEALALAWITIRATPGVAYAELAPGLLLIGVGAACLFAPIQTTLLGAVRPEEHGQAAGVATAIRELAAVLGVAAVGGIFAANGASPHRPRSSRASAPR
jgi:predicted MFS family arabinose efflux permease